MKKLTKEDVLARCKQIYGDKYDYSKINYINYDTKIVVICSKHGEFEIRPDHFFSGCGCPKCGHEKGGAKISLTKDEFVDSAKKTHGNKYDYSKVNYINAKTKVCIICPEHGEFWQTPDAHVRGANCPKCNTVRNYKYSIKEFVEKSKKIHGDKYDYSKTEYVNYKTPLCIICPEHGEFWQKPREHFKGCGCPSCDESKLECEVKLFLEKNNIKYEREKRFEWLRYKYPLVIDFYLPEHNIAIECQGEQHFKDRKFFEHYSFEKRIEMDNLKFELCKKNGLKVLYYSKKYLIPSGWDKYDVITDKEKLLKKILEK